MPEEKVVINIEKFGNTTAATIPLALSDAVRQPSGSSAATPLLMSLGGRGLHSRGAADKVGAEDS